VVVTPHIAFNSTEALERILPTTAENIQVFDAGKPANVIA
jgi:D-lactate dehydrogenase